MKKSGQRACPVDVGDRRLHTGGIGGWRLAIGPGSEVRRLPVADPEHPCAPAMDQARGVAGVMFGVTVAEALEGVRQALPILRGDKRPDGTVRCWWCGIEPDSLIDITRLEQAEREYLPNWPPGDHTHAERPPTPGELEQAGHRALRVILEQA